MLTFGLVSFAAPWALAALAALPFLWWLLRITPPEPQAIRFPPIRLLFSLASRQESAEQSPLWLLILRLLLAVTLITGIAHPLINAGATLTGTGPLLLVVDNGWAAARNWTSRQSLMVRLVDQADREGRGVALIPTAPEEGAPRPSVRILPAAEARPAVQALAPKPWPTDRAAALSPLTALSGTGGMGGADFQTPAHVVWLSDGLEETRGGSVAHLARSLKALGSVTVFTVPPGRTPLVLRPPVSEGSILRITAVRAAGSGTVRVHLRALAADGRLLAREALVFSDGSRKAETRLDLPAELRNRLARLEIEDQTTAGAVVLADERWRRRPVGLLESEGATAEQPLLGERHYLSRALEPFSEVRRGTVTELLARELAVMMLPDPPPLIRRDRQMLERWIDSGGVAVRFAGPRLAQSPDALLPVKITAGDRTIGGAMSWQDPVALAPFEDDSPFFGLDATGGTAGDIRIRRQVLARPSLDLASKTWARLDDGTPLVTAEARGKGWLVLIHTTANTAWSNLALSGLFVQMLKRMVALSQGVVSKPGGPPLAPIEMLDGFARLGPAAKGALAISGDAFEKTVAGPKHPPGYYGDAAARRALNLRIDPAAFRPMGALPSGVSAETYGQAEEVDLKPWLLATAMILMVIELAVSLAFRGLLRITGMSAVVLVMIFSAGLRTAQAQTQAQPQALAQTPDSRIAEATLTTHLAYVLTGNQEVDETSLAGLRGLSVIVNRRTAAELSRPIGVDPETDILVFYPLLYWPLTAGQARPSADAVARLNAYLLGGGTILFDTRDRSGGGGERALSDLVSGLDIPRLTPVRADHVLTRSYYLIDEFPGRWTGDTVWVEVAGERVNDGVSPVIVGSHDWAAAWAMDDLQRPMFAAVPGGERQRELAYRFGINLVMYTLTGNYKADQVHLPEIMKRLGK